VLRASDRRRRGRIEQDGRVREEGLERRVGRRLEETERCDVLEIVLTEKDRGEDDAERPDIHLIIAEGDFREVMD
jgi:hypothetical protein